MSQTPLPSYPPGNPPQPSNWSGPRDVNPRMKPEPTGPVIPDPLPPAPTPAPVPRPYVAQAAQGVRAQMPNSPIQRRFDPSFLQNLALFAAQNLNRPNGQLQFNPLATRPGTGLDQFGSALGGGNAPLRGLPQTLLGQALMQRFGGR